MSSSGDEVSAYPQHEYEAIEKAVMESARGRWFLQEFARRNRAADTLTLLDAITRLKNTMDERSGSAAKAELVALARSIHSARAEIVKTRDDRLPEGGAIGDDAQIYAAIAEQARRTAGEMMAGTQTLQAVASELIAANNNEPHASKLAESLRSFETLAWSEELLSRRIAIAMGLLAHVDERVSGMAGLVGPQPIEPRHLGYFADGERLFEPPAKDASPAPAGDFFPSELGGATVTGRQGNPASNGAVPEPQAESTPPKPQGDDQKTRIVIIRKPSGEAVDIPFADELPERVA